MIVVKKIKKLIVNNLKKNVIKKLIINHNEGINV